MFKVGNRVSYSPQNHIATIVKELPENRYIVEFDDHMLIPPQMTVPGEFLSKLPCESKCPYCGKEWTETIIGRNIFYDCIPCKLKKEDV